MDQGKARISACMVLYHAGDEALRAVECLEKSDVKVDVYLVDNSPECDTATRIQWKYPGVKVLRQDKNLGFGRGNNVVLPLLESEYHLLINPDVTFDETLLSRMIAYMDERKNVAILTPRVFGMDGNEQFLPCQGMLQGEAGPPLHHLARGVYPQQGAYLHAHPGAVRHRMLPAHPHGAVPEAGRL